MHLKKSLQCMFLIYFVYFCLQNKALNVKAHDKSIIFNNSLNKFLTRFKKLYVYHVYITKT